MAAARSHNDAGVPLPPADEMVLGLDIGGTTLAAGVVAGDGRVLAQQGAPSRATEGPASMIDRLLALARVVVEESDVPWSRLRGIGIACGGPLDPFAGIIQSPPNLPAWDDIPIVDIVERALGLPAAVDNDATASALAEDWYGAGREHGAHHLVYLTISTGIGGGLVIDGRPYRGAGGNAVELGHLTVRYDGRRCACGRRGCLEAYASGTSIALRAREALARGRASSLVGIADVTARDVAAAARAGDSLAVEVWSETTAIVGSAIANVLNDYNPDLVVLGGGVTRAGDLLLGPVREVAFSQALPPARRSAEIVLARLGDELGVVGAATVAFERLATASGRLDRMPVGARRSTRKAATEREQAR